MMKLTTLFCVSIICLSVIPSICRAQTVRDPGLQVQQVVSGLNSPTAMAFIGQNDFLVLQKNDGRVRRVIGGVLQSGEVLDVAVDNSSERGLLGIAVHPAFPGTPHVYLYYTESSTGSDTSGSPAPLGNRVYRFIWNGSALVSPSLFASLPATPGPNHNGGTISFGPDGKLYVVIGDLNRDGQLQNYPAGPVPDDTSVILRLNDDGSVPGDNPFSAQGGNLAKYYAYGIRNSFGLAFDPVNGRLWMTENGPNFFDEINLVAPGFNSGWEKIMGPDARDPQGIGDLFQIAGSHYRDPEFSWLDTVGPTAMVFLNSLQLGGQYQNDAFVGDINNGNLYRFRLNAARDGFAFVNSGLADRVADNAGELDELIFGTGFAGITDLKVGPDGRLYVVSYFQGRVFAISGTGAGANLGVSPTSIPVGGTLTATWGGIATPSSTDWIGLFVPGAGATAFIDWIYVSCSKTRGSPVASGSCPFVLPGTLTPGTYELRLLASNGFTTLATSPQFAVTGATSLSVSPTSAPAGGTLTASWSGIAAPSATDWIGLFVPGAASTAFIDWIYVSCSKTAGSPAASGACSFLLPRTLAPGTYELRLLANNGFTTLATSPPFTVTGAISFSVSPTSSSPGATLTATWSGIATPSSTDWIGLFVPGAASTAYIEWIYVSCSKTAGSPAASGACSFVLPGTLAPSTYELRLLANNGYTTLATSSPFTVTATRLSVSPTSSSAGGTLTASWSSIEAPSPTDWIGLFVPEAGPTAYIEWIYVSCSKTAGSPAASGACSFVLPGTLASGTYELRLLANNGFTQLAVSNAFTVTP